MMRERLIALRERRAQLVARSEAQRIEVFALVHRMDRLAAWFDRAREAGQAVRRNPAWLAVGGALALGLFAALRPGRTLKLVATGVSLWRGWRRLRAMIDRLVPTPPTPRRAY